ncbi:MAG: FAD-binding protein [Chloroflexi bacterium]|nr:FAD-binding protein [Chloroflexota bacterium]
MSTHSSDGQAERPRRRIDRAALNEELAAIVGRRAVLTDEYDLRLYQYDGSIDTALPDAIVFPVSTEQVQSIVRLANREGLPVVARGAGTGLSGGALAVEGGIVIAFARMNHILDVDLDSMRALVEPGVVNLHLSQAVAHHGVYYVPDPSSQKACTIGGNVAENAGGPHTLAYGVTTNHVLGLEVVLSDGSAAWLGGPAVDGSGYDLVGLMVGSEGTFGIVTKVLVKLTPSPEKVKTLLAIFATVADAANAVSAVIGAGIVPAALEMMDHTTLTAVEEAFGAGYPLDAGAVLLIELEGLGEGLEQQAGRITELCRGAAAREVRVAKDDKERALLWRGRKEAFGALGRISPEYYVMDGVVPRSRIAEVLDRIGEIGRRHGFLIANVFHAGDGNLHPVLLFDPEKPGEIDRVREAGAEVLKVCAEVGGTLSGEHGIGVEKKDLMHLIFSDVDLEAMKSVRRVFDPIGLCNPGKIFPTPGRCADIIEHPGIGVASAAGMGW